MSTVLIDAPADTVAVAPGGLNVSVVGSPKMIAEAVAEVLGSHGFAARPSWHDGDLAVLIDPDDGDWALAAAAACPVIVLHEHPITDEVLLDAVARGAAAVRPLHSDIDDLLDALRTAWSGEVVLDTYQATVVVKALRAHHHQAITLTERERDILRLVRKGHSVKQTARVLGISPKTVENLQRHMFQKLGVRNRTQAVARAHALGLLKDDL